MFCETVARLVLCGNNLSLKGVLCSFFPILLLDWIILNLRNELDLGYIEVEWQSLFGIIYWNMWKQKNMWIFQVVDVDLKYIIISSWSWVRFIKHSLVLFVGFSRSLSRCSQWKPPPSGFIKLNIDGVRSSSLGFASTAVVVRDVKARWLGGVGRNIRRCSVMIN